MRLRTNSVISVDDARVGTYNDDKHGVVRVDRLWKFSTGQLVLFDSGSNARYEMQSKPDKDTSSQQEYFVLVSGFRS